MLEIWHNILGLIVLALGFAGAYFGGRYVNEHVYGDGSSALGWLLVAAWLGSCVASGSKLLGVL